MSITRRRSLPSGEAVIARKVQARRPDWARRPDVCPDVCRTSLGHKRLQQGRYAQETHYLHVYVRQLRQKLGDDTGIPRLIVTEPGVGYRWVPDPTIE